MRFLPNLITLTRIVLALGVAVVLMHPSGPFLEWAFGLFLIAALSDALDGFLARAFNAVTGFGKVLDPIADKLLVAATLLGLIAAGALTGLAIVAVALILARELSVTILRIKARRSETLAVTPLAKWKTLVQLTASGLVLLGAASGIPALFVAGIIALWIAAALTLYTGGIYMRAALSPPMPDRTGRET